MFSKVKFILSFLLFIFIFPLLFGISCREVNIRIKKIPLKSSYISCFITSLDENMLYVGDREKGVYRSDANGRRWLNVSKGLEERRVCALAPSLIFPNVIYAATEYGGIWKSDDYGNKWKLLSTVDAIKIFFIAFSPYNSNVVFVGGGEAGLFRSFDKGKIFHRVVIREFPSKVDVYSICFNKEEESMFLGTNFGVYKADAQGYIFEKLPLDEKTFSIACDPFIKGRIYVGTTRGLFISEDGGESFTLKAFPNYIVRRVAPNPYKIGEIYLGVDRLGVYKSNDYGENFHKLEINLLSTKIVNILFIKERRVQKEKIKIYIATANGGIVVKEEKIFYHIGIRKSINVNSIFFSKLFDSISPLIVATENNGLLLLNEKGNIKKTYLPDRNIEAISYDRKKNIIYIGVSSDIKWGEKGGLYILKDNQLNLVSNEVGDVSDITIDNEEVYIATENKGLFKLSKEGILTPLGLKNTIINDILIIGKRIIYAACSEGLYISYDGGNSWQYENLLGVKQIYSLAACRFSCIYIAAKEGLYKKASKDRIYSKLSDKEIYQILIKQDKIYLATKDGIYILKKDKEVAKFLDKTKITSIAIDKNKIYAASDKGIIIKLEII